MDREIKLFLLNGDTVDTSLNIGQKIPVQLSKFNLQSLLNLPEAASLYSTLVNL